MLLAPLLFCAFGSECSSSSSCCRPGLALFLIAFLLVPLLPFLLHLIVHVVVWTVLFHGVSSSAKWLLEGGDGFSCGAMRKAAAAARCAREPSSASKRNKPSPPPDHSSVSLSADKAAYRIDVSAPGVASSDLSIKLQAGEPSVITVKGATTARGSVDRTIYLPEDAAVEGTTAAHADGLLTITVPRKQRPPPRHIRIAPPAAAAPSATGAGPTPAHCDPEKKRVLLSQIRSGVALKKAAPPKTSSGPVVVQGAAVEPAVAKSPQPEPQPEPAAADSSEWEEVAENLDETILQELEELGFADKALNATMLAKHGSVKGAVKELMALRKRK